MGRYLLWVFAIMCIQTSSVTGIAVDPKAKHHIEKRCAPESRECCRFPIRTQPFDECCMKYGCCPDCDNVTVKPCDIALAYLECCQYSQSSQAFNDCCDRHGCCPICNGTISQNGCDLQEAKKECCPLKNNSIAFNTCCLKYECCPLCDGCIDADGAYHDEMTGWLDPDDPCLVYSCFQGVITKHINHNCNGCYDEHGIYHESMTGWFDPTDPCIHYYCKDGVISSQTIICLDPTCQFPITKPGECCPICNGCYDKNGVYHESMTGWPDPYDPCVYYRCVDGQITTHIRECPPITCQHPIQRPCECCPYCIPDDDCDHNGHDDGCGHNCHQVNVHVNQQVINQK